MIALDKRLSAVAELILPCTVLVDIGTDHGKIAAYTALSGLAAKVVATDVSAASLSKARALCSAYGLTNVDFRVGDGCLPVLESEYDTVVIAGMGAHEIASILSGGLNKWKRYILVPHRNPDFLRRYLAQNDICPYCDRKIYAQERYYDVIGASAGEYRPSEREVLYGKPDETVDCLNYYTAERSKLNGLLRHVSGSSADSVRKKLELLEMR